MIFTRAGIVALLVMGLAPAAWAQGLPERLDGVPLEPPPVDVSKLPIDLQRLHRELRQTTVREEREGLNLRYVIEVFGQAPRLLFFTREDNLVTGPVPYGAPTHREIVEHITPKEYRAPAADFSALVRWLAERAKK